MSQMEELACALCGEKDRDKLLVENLGIAIGMGGDDYSFCKSCWLREDLGQRLLDYFGFPSGMKLEV